jgi:hypothetical protein
VLRNPQSLTRAAVQVTLAFKAMAIDPVIMSAGELEAGNAGEPAKLVRQRYREAGDIIKKGRMSSLFINDLDAGAGRMGASTQYTVNNQMVNATLMNIADNPTNVQLPGVYKSEEVPRVPIICTGAPLLPLPVQRAKPAWAQPHCGCSLLLRGWSAACAHLRDAIAPARLRAPARRPHASTNHQATLRTRRLCTHDRGDAAVAPLLCSRR